jgi:hypothetical protein
LQPVRVLEQECGWLVEVVLLHSAVMCRRLLIPVLVCLQYGLVVM